MCVLAASRLPLPGEFVKIVQVYLKYLTPFGPDGLPPHFVVAEAP